jgi:glutathione S-transferase
MTSRRSYDASPPTWRVQLALAEKQLDWEEIKIAYDSKPDVFLEVNPRGQVPALRAGALAVFETNAILEYLDFAFPEPPLLPADPGARAAALTRINEASNYLMPAFMAVWRHRASRGDAKRGAELIGEVKAELARWERYLDQAGGGWFVGGALSLADLSVYPYLAGAIRGGLAMDSFPRLRAFYETMTPRASVQRTWPSSWKDTSATPFFA